MCLQDHVLCGAYLSCSCSCFCNVLCLCCATRLPVVRPTEVSFRRPVFSHPAPQPLFYHFRGRRSQLSALAGNIQINRMKSTNTSDNTDANANCAYRTCFFERHGGNLRHVVMRMRKTEVTCRSLPFLLGEVAIQKSRPCSFSYAWQPQLGTQASIPIVVLQSYVTYGIPPF